MSDKKYPCPLSDKPCKYGGNKYYYYGYVQGAASYCRFNKKWTCDMFECPLPPKKEPK